MNLFDGYEIRARLAPAFVVTTPLMLVLVALVPELFTSVASSTVALFVLLAFLYMVSFFVRYLGKRVEPHLWSSWGGPPSTVVVQSSDSTFSTRMKEEIRREISQQFGLTVPSAEERKSYPEEVQQVFGRVRQLIRQNDPNGLWDRHNAEYGFLRNLYGSWSLWMLLGVISTIVCISKYVSDPSNYLAACAVASMVLNAVILIVRFVFLPSAIRTAAFRYAESAWLSFLSIGKKL